MILVETFIVVFSQWLLSFLISYYLYPFIFVDISVKINERNGYLVPNSQTLLSMLEISVEKVS